MRSHTQAFKDEIKQYGRQLSSIMYTGSILIQHLDNTYTNSLYRDEINSIQYYYDCELFKTCMQTLVIDSKVEIPIGTSIDCRLGVKVNNANENLIFGIYYVNKVEQQKDKKSWLVTCYDKMIETMKDYESFYNATTDTTFITDKNYYYYDNDKQRYKRYTGARTGNPTTLGLYQSAFPMTIRDYILAICNRLNISTMNISQETLGNFLKQVTSEHYIDVDGNKMGYTYRDVLDEIAKALGEFIYISSNSLTTKSCISTDDTINEDYFNDKNVNIGKKIGPYNVVVLSRASDSDNIHYPAILPSNPIEFKITNNLILEQDNRQDFIQTIYNRITGLEFYTNDFTTKGIMYYEIGDKFNVSIDGVTYPCLMLSDDIIRTTGLKENIRTTEPQQSVTPYKYASYSDKVAITSKNAKILVDKANASIEQIVEAVGDNGEVTTASIVQSINDSGSQIKLNADKVYINGVTFDENQNMTMTDGTIALEDNPETEVIPSISITTSNDNNSKIGLWSKKISSSERYEDYTSSNRYVEGYGLSHNKQTGSTWADLITQFRLGRGTEYSSASSDNFYQFREGIEMYHIRSYSGADYSSSSIPHSVIRIWDKNDTSNPVSYITEKNARLKDTFIDGILQAYLGFALWNGDFKVGYNGSKIYANTYDDSPVVVNNIRTKNMFDKSIIVQGDITGVGTTRLNSRQVLYLSEGTYTFSCPNIASPYEWGLQIQNIGVPPLSAWPTLIYETGWINSNTKSRTFTLTTSGWFTLMLRKSNNSTITPSEVTNINFQLETGSSATSYSPYQYLNENTNDTGWVNCTTSQGTWNYCQVRRIGKIVKLRAYASSLGRPSGAVFTIPSGFRPSEQEGAYGTADWVSAPTITRWWFNTDGTCGMDWNLSLVNGTDITENTWKRVTTTWFID